jgi:hypothetical protein
MTKIYHFDCSNNLFCKENNITIDWEKEVLTEYKSYLYIKDNFNLPLSYIAYPWALLIDYYHNNKLKTFYNFLEKLNLIEPLKDKTDFSITVVQSYHFKKFLPDFQKLGIKYIFSPHITKNDFLSIFYKYNIIVYPYYIYPAITSNNINLFSQNANMNKHLIYNFIGNVNYSKERPTLVRNNIINMKHLENSFVKKLEEWHFNQAVYHNQLNIINSNLSSIEDKIKRENEYREIMKTSLFSICPLGIGPNSIRLWESLTYNTIPVSISDNLWLPFYIDIDWKGLIIDIKEDNYQDILNLGKINSDRITQYQDKIMNFYQSYLVEGKFGSIINNIFKECNMVTLLLPWYNHDDKKSLRYKEIHQCLEINLKNKYIKSIIFFYEVSNEEEILFEDYIHAKIKIIPVITNKKRDISFNRLVMYANQNLINELCIISNNDIYFDDTLTMLSHINFYKNNYFISLTRKNHDKYLDNTNKVWKPHSASQDSWMFVSPIKLMKNEINLGWIQCDNIISASYNSLGYQVINPHYSINTWHLHMYNNTNELLEKYNYNYQYQMKKIKLESIEDINKSTTNTIFNIEDNIIEDNIVKKVNKLNISKLSSLKKKWILRENS